MHAHADINVTPLIDVILTLLIIFMVVTPTQSSGLDAQIPHSVLDSDHPPPNQYEDNSIVVSVGKDLSLRINQEAITRERLASRLTEIYKNRGDRILFLQGAQEIPFNEIVSIIDFAKKLGVDRVGLLTLGSPRKTAEVY